MAKNPPPEIDFIDGGDVIVPDGTPGGFTDLSDALTPLQAAKLHDPGIANLIDTPEHPAPAAQTTDPHRITFMLPNSEKTVFSLGEAGDDEKHIKDTGITGRTEKHVHFHTEEGETKTMLVLGVGSHEGFAGYKGEILKTGNGILAVTQSNVWIDGNEQFYGVAREKDLVLRAAGEKDAPKVLVQSDEGPVFVRGEAIVMSGKNEVVIAAHTASEKLDPTYNTRVKTTLVEESKKHWTQWATNMIEWTQIVVTVVDAVRGLAHERKEAKKEGAGWKLKSWSEFAEIIVESAKLIKTGMAAYKAHETPGSVAIHAEHEIGVTAGGDVEIFGKMGAAVASPLSVDIIGGYAGVKGATFASLWAGINASVASGNIVSISAGKEAKITGKKEVKLKGEEVKLGAEHDAVMFSEKHASVFGESWVYVASNGYGMKAEPSKLFIGKVEEPKEYGKAKGDKASVIKINDDSINIVNQKGGYKVEKGCIKIYTPSGNGVFELDDNICSVQGNHILVG